MPDLELLLVNSLPGAAYREHVNTALWVGVALALLGLLCMLALTWLPNILLLHKSIVLGNFQFKKIHAKASGHFFPALFSGALALPLALCDATGSLSDTAL